MENVERIALGFFGKPSVRAHGDLFGNMDMAAFAGFSRNSAGYEGRGEPALPAGRQSADRARLALQPGNGRIPRMAVLCCRRFQ